MPNIVDNFIKNLPYSNLIGGESQESLNKKFEIFSDASITREEKVQRLSVTNQFDNQLEFSNPTGMWTNTLSDLLYSTDSNDKTRRIEGYRQMSSHSDISDCLREICNEFITKDGTGKIMQFALRGDYNEEVKEEVKEEFYKFLKIFDLEYKGWNYMKDFLVEAEVLFENIVSLKEPERGIIGVTRIAPERIDPFYHDLDNELIDCFILRRKMLDDKGRQFNHNAALDKKNQILFLNEKQITYIHSGEWDYATGGHTTIGRKKYRRPHIDHGAVKFKQLSLIEDATIIYMLVRAPERLVFNIDTGHLPPGKAEAYLKRQMSEFWNRKTVGRDGRVENVYDPMTLLENYYFAKPRGSDGSTVTPIGGGSASPDNMDLLTLFINRLYKSMGVPLQRLNAEAGFSDGMDITREELRFAEFVIRLQQNFAKGIKSSFITHLKLKDRKISKLAAKFEVTSISENKEYYDFSDWNNYDQLTLTINERVESEILFLREKIKEEYSKMKVIKEELENGSELVLLL